jgi:hypothetical protein
MTSHRAIAAKPAASVEPAALDVALRDPRVQLAMRARCEQQGHQWESVTVWRGGFPGPVRRHSYSICAWCEERR